MLHEEYLSYLYEITTMSQYKDHHYQRLQLQIDILETTLFHAEQIRYDLEQQQIAVTSSLINDFNCFTN